MFIDLYSFRVGEGRRTNEEINKKRKRVKTNQEIR